jgi:hypothetical protein
MRADGLTVSLPADKFSDNFITLRGSNRHAVGPKTKSPRPVKDEGFSKVHYCDRPEGGRSFNDDRLV